MFLKVFSEKKIILTLLLQTIFITVEECVDSTTPKANVNGRINNKK